MNVSSLRERLHRFAKSLNCDGGRGLALLGICSGLLLIQAGGLIAGASAGYVALHTTVRGTPEERAASVSFWGFRAPLGAWISIWGCGAMLTSAPFDNWWHNAYGLDVKIISPPHALLLLGVCAVEAGVSSQESGVHCADRGTHKEVGRDAGLEECDDTSRLYGAEIAPTGQHDCGRHDNTPTLRVLSSTRVKR